MSTTKVAAFSCSGSPKTWALNTPLQITLTSKLLTNEAQKKENIAGAAKVDMGGIIKSVSIKYIRLSQAIPMGNISVNKHMKDVNRKNGEERFSTTHWA